MVTGNDALARVPEDLDLFVSLGLHLTLAAEVFPLLPRHPEEQLVAVSVGGPPPTPCLRVWIDPQVDQFVDGAEAVDVEADDAASIRAKACADAQHL